MTDEKVPAIITNQPEENTEAPKPQSPTDRGVTEIAEELANETIAQLRAAGLRD